MDLLSKIDKKKCLAILPVEKWSDGLPFGRIRDKSTTRMAPAPLKIVRFWQTCAYWKGNCENYLFLLLINSLVFCGKWMVSRYEILVLLAIYITKKIL